MTTLEGILALILAAGFLVGVVWFAIWNEHRDGRSAAAEMAYATLMIGQLAESLDFELERVPLQLPGGEVPTVPVITGTRKGYGITIKPTYVRGGGEGFKDEYPYSDQRMSLEIQPRPGNTWRVSAHAAWLGEKVSDAKRGAFLALCPPASPAIEQLLSRDRRPLYVIGMYLKPQVLGLLVKYARPPKVKFQGYVFRERTDPKDLLRILDTLVEIAEALPSTTG